MARVLLLIVFTTLITLGIWQLKRHEWKAGILGRMGAEYALDASRTRLSYADLQPGTEPYFFRRGTLEGKLDFTKEIALQPRTYNGKAGFHILTPLTLNDGYTVLVNRGWTDAAPVKKPVRSKYVRITGAARMPDWNHFTPKNDPATNNWFRADVAQIAEVLKLGETAPSVFFAEDIAPPVDGTILEATRLEIPNDHAQYAAFWFFMAALLPVLAFLYAKRKKSS